jgi:two-component system, OmpR family, phosphate regulon sensor histidine kinase PhoR
MKKRIPDPLLILVTILVIISFQVYWLSDNYQREKRSMQIKTNVIFQETVRELQAANLKFPVNALPGPGSHQKTRIYIDDDISQKDLNSKRPPGREIITMVNALKHKANDSLKVDTTFNSTIVIALNDSQQLKKDSGHIVIKRNGEPDDHILNILYRVDSLQDSIKLPDIKKKYGAALQKQNIGIHFLITRTQGAANENDDDMSAVVIGFAHPVTYHLTLLNTSPYLLKKISLPILFSVLLIGITLVTFTLLYRNLLRQQRLADIKNEFISNITHELKTPIATVGVAIEALKNFNAIHDAQKTKEYLDISSNELQRLGLLVDKVLKLSMFEKKEIELNKEYFNIMEVTREVLDAMKPQFEKQNAAVTLNSSGPQFIIYADKLHITSVLYNLFDNALKYSNNEPVIGIEISSGDNSITLVVKDNGIGIAHEYRKKIFEKFFRVPSGNRHSVKGYGLGLSYVSEIIKRHGGSIDVESELDQGSTFIVKLPIGETPGTGLNDNQKYADQQL